MKITIISSTGFHFHGQGALEFLVGDKRTSICTIRSPSIYLGLTEHGSARNKAIVFLLNCAGSKELRNLDEELKLVNQVFTENSECQFDYLRAEIQASVKSFEELSASL